MDTGVCFLTETKRSKAKWSLGDIRRADGKWRMLDNHDETLRAGEREKESDSEIESKRERERERKRGGRREEKGGRHSETALGTNGQVFSEIPEILSRWRLSAGNGFVDFAGWRYRVPPETSLILFR